MAPSEKGIDEGVEAYFGERPGTFCSDVAQERTHDTLRKVVRFNGSAQSHFSETGCEVPVSTNDFSNEAAVREMI